MDCFYSKSISFAHTVAVMRLHLSKKKHNPLLIFTFLKHFLRCMIIINALSFIWVAINRTSLLNSFVKVTSGCVERKKMRNVNILVIEIYHINFSKISNQYCYLICLKTPKRFCIFSNLFDSQRVGTPIINEWTCVAMLCCHGKSKK